MVVVFGLAMMKTMVCLFPLLNDLTAYDEEVLRMISATSSNPIDMLLMMMMAMDAEDNMFIDGRGRFT